MLDCFIPLSAGGVKEPFAFISVLPVRVRQVSLLEALLALRLATKLTFVTSFNILADCDGFLILFTSIS